MARKKLARFRENAEFEHVLEPQRNKVLQGWPVQGRWNKDVFKNDAPIVLEIGCGKGEYTVALAQKFPGRNFVGIDIKGARIWYGARQAYDENMSNVAFLRSQVELIDHCFAENEVDEIWITHPDPQIKHRRQKHRLTHPGFLERYRKILKPGGLVHLKTDSEFLHGYTQGILQMRGDRVLQAYFDIDRQLADQPHHVLHTVQTHYEQMFRKEGKKVTYIKFQFES